MIQAAIFDIDGTLIDSVEGHARAWEAAFREYGHEPGLEALRRQIGKGSDQLLPCFLRPEEIARHGEAIDERQGKIFKTRHLADVKAFPRVRDLFEQLRRDGVKCVLGSSGKPADVQQAEAIADIQGLVDAMATSEDVDRSKPSPDIVQVALEKIAPISASRCVFVGDTPWDAQAARRAGVMALGISSPVFNENELRMAGCQHVFASIADLRHDYEQLLSLA
jgi:HAD superfamily hydrolase (TIGR01509 family)